MTPEQRVKLIEAIQTCREVQLGYERRDGSRSLHVVAPMDLRMGDTPTTEETEYLWAFCLAESEAEMHLCERILAVRLLGVFEPRDILAIWPSERWPLPQHWCIARDWPVITA